MNEDTERDAPADLERTERGDRHETDRLLEALERLRVAEERRREAPFSSPEFYARSRDVERQSREIFRLADLEEESADPGDGGDPAAGGAFGWPTPDEGEAPRD